VLFSIMEKDISQSDEHYIPADKKLKENNLENPKNLEEQSINETETETKEISDSKEKSQRKTSFEDKANLEAFASQLVSGYFNENRDITAGIKNFLKVWLATVKMERILIYHFVPYTRQLVVKQWRTMLDFNLNMMQRCFPAVIDYKDKTYYKQHFRKSYRKFFDKMFERFNLNKNDKDTLIKLFLSGSNSKTLLEQLENLVMDELGLQSLQTLFQFFENAIIEDLGNENENENPIESFRDLMFHSYQLRNRCAHHILLHQEIFEEVRNNFLTAKKKYIDTCKELEEPKFFQEFANTLDGAGFEEIFARENPQEEQDLIGVDFKLPCDHRKRTRGETNIPKLPVEESNANLVKILKETFSEKEASSQASDQERVRKILKELPEFREIFYEAYKDVVEENVN